MIICDINVHRTYVDLKLYSVQGAGCVTLNFVASSQSICKQHNWIRRGARKLCIALLNESVVSIELMS